MSTYILLIEYHDGTVIIAKGSDGKSHIVAREGNQYLLREIGDRLLDDNLIASYQLAVMVGEPVTAEVLAGDHGRTV